MSKYVILFVILLSAFVGGMGCSSCEDRAVTFTTVEREGAPHAINEGENVWSDSASVPLQFTHEQTFGAEAGSAMLGRVTDLAVDEKGSIYVLDGANHQLIAFRPDGSIRWTAGREGQGPGELENARSMVWDGGDHLYVANQYGGRIDRWTTEGTYEEGVSAEQFDERFHQFVGFAEGLLVTTGPAMGGDPQPVYTIDTTDWTMEKRFSIDLGLELPEGLGTTASHSLHGTMLYVGHIDRYEVSRYALDGTLQRRIVREVDYPVGPAAFTSGGRGTMMVFSSLQPVGRLSSGHELVYVRWPTNVDDPNAYARQRRSGGEVKELKHVAAFDLYDADGRLLGSLRWDGSSPLGRPLYLSKDDKLYTYDNAPFPQVRHYEVSVRRD